MGFKSWTGLKIGSVANIFKESEKDWYREEVRKWESENHKWN